MGNKLDLREERVIQTEKAKEMSDKYNSTYYEVSSKTGEGVEEMFQSVVKTYYENPAVKGDEQKSEVLRNPQSGGRGKCC